MLESACTCSMPGYLSIDVGKESCLDNMDSDGLSFHKSDCSDATLSNMQGDSSVWASFTLIQFMMASKSYFT